MEKKRIAILDFTANNLPRSHSSYSRDQLEVYLYKTQKFEILERNKIKLILKEQRLQKTSCKDTVCAVEIGKLLSVQYIITGSINKIGNYSVSIKVLDVGRGIIFYADTEKAEQERDIDSAMERLAARIAANIYSKKIAIKDSTLGDNRKNAKNLNRVAIQNAKDLSVGLHFNTLFPVGKMSNVVHIGYGGTVSFFYKDIFIKNLHAGADIGFNYFPGKKSEAQWFLYMPLFASVGYRFNALRILSIVPSVHFGGAYNILSYDDDSSPIPHSPEYKNEHGIAPVLKCAILVEMELSNTLTTSINCFYHALFEKSSTISLFGLSAGIGYRL